MIKLDNGIIQLLIQKPGSIYKSARFDWTGQITQVTYKNKYFFCTTESLLPFLMEKQGQGLYNEFGIDYPIGYDNCPIGSCFPKIGVGCLVKESLEPYDFFKDYKIIHYSFPFTVESIKAHFICKAEQFDSHYSFKLEKSIELKQNSFIINYTLHNYGKKEIRTNEYVHNFLSINGKPVGGNYELSFPFKLNPDKFGFVLNPKETMQFKEKTVKWNKPITGNKQFFVSNINSDYHSKGAWSLVDRDEKIGIQEEADFDVQKINLWGATHVISPELFFEIKVCPNNKISWSRKYTVFILD